MKSVSSAADGASRLSHLDALRGIASLLVVYMHALMLGKKMFVVTSGAEYWIWFLTARVFEVGKIGVVLFFALSGYIIPNSLRSSTRPILSFAISRFFRLYPAYWLSLAVAVSLSIVLGGPQLKTGVVLANMTMLQAAFRTPDVLVVYWTLFIEMVFYSLCAFHFINRRKLFDDRYCFIWACGLLALAVGLGWIRFHTHSKAPVALVLALSIMHWSSVWRSSLSGNAKAKRLSWIYLGLFVFLMPVVALLAYDFDLGFEESWYRYTLSYYAGIAIFLVFTRFTVLKGKVLTGLGLISYSVYLFHTLVGRGLNALHVQSFALGSPHLYACFVLAATLPVSWLTFRLVERPGQILGSLLRTRICGRTAKSPRVMDLSPQVISVTDRV
jgi:peptidoglycan/LPS O-acetylase OafA/YrhL